MSSLRKLVDLSNDHVTDEKPAKDISVTDRDTSPLLLPTDITAALGLLSRLPVPVDGAMAAARGAAAAWAYPVAGFVIGALMALIASMALWLGLSAPIAAGLALTACVIVTGAMHEDGLADSADGLWGGWEPARRLEIMKDSHIGVYGVCALVLSLLLRWIALTALVAAGLHWAAIITAAMASRAALTALMIILPNARGYGLSQMVGRPTGAVAWVALAIALLATIGLWGWFGLLVGWIAGVLVLLCAAIARAKIGGQTGDILGATQQITELAVLLILVASLSS